MKNFFIVKTLKERKKNCGFFFMTHHRSYVWPVYLNVYNTKANEMHTLTNPLFAFNFSHAAHQLKIHNPCFGGENEKTKKRKKKTFSSKTKKKSVTNK